MNFLRMTCVAVAGGVLAGCGPAFNFPWQQDAAPAVRPPAVAAPAEPADVEAVPADQVEVWTPEDEIDEEQRQRDAAGCHAMARAQVARDMRIDDNIRVGREDFGRAGDLDAWQQSMDNYGYGERQRALFERCMRQLDYTPE